VEDADEFKSSLPPLQSGPGSKIRIPPALMPDDETTLHYFELYFSNVHPYVPVLDKNLFLQQWHRNRDALSPLLIEAIFAIAGRLADEPAQGQQWLALASSTYHRPADTYPNNGRRDANRVVQGTPTHLWTYPDLAHCRP
jgi:hypothetical protein